MFKKFLFLLFLKFLSYLVCVPSFKLINSNSIPRKKYDRNNFTPTPCKRLRGENTLTGIGLIKLTQDSDKLNYRSFFKYSMLQTVLHIFFCGTKCFVSKLSCILHFFDLVWVGIWCYSIKCFVFLVIFYKIIENYGLISYSRYNFLGIAVKAILLKTPTNTYFRHYVIHSKDYEI